MNPKDLNTNINNNDQQQKIEPELQDNQRAKEGSTADETNSNNNMSLLDDPQWQSLASDWQSQPVVETDIKALIKETKQRTRWAKALLGFDIIGTIGIFIGFIYQFFAAEQDNHLKIYLGLATLGSFIYTVYAIRIRKAAWSAMCESPERALETAIKGAESSLKYIQAIIWSFYGMTPLANWFIYNVATSREKSPFWGLAVFNIIMLVSFVAMARIKSRRAKELAHLNQQ